MQPYDSLLHRMFARIYRCISTVQFFCLYRPIHATHRPEIKEVFLDIKDNYFRRYLYLFLKFLHFEGYVVYLPPHPKLMYALRNDVYASYLLEEKIVHFARPQAKAGMLHISQALISADYFSGLLNDQHCASFYVPMSQHPSMYHLGYWNTPLENRVRKKSVFMAGNFASAEYYTIEKDGIFALLSRNAIYAYLKQEELLFQITTENQLAAFLESRDDHKVILINRRDFDIPMNELRPLLGKFDFFFALPGMVMPFAHNIVEAMSAGAIPFLQEGYADLFQPALIDGRQAITFKDINDLKTRLGYLQGLSSETIAEMRENVLHYYDSYLTPRGVVARIESRDYKNIYLQAEHYSVELLKNRRHQIGAESA